MANVFLRRVTVQNWKDCINLTLAPGQEAYIPTNLYSIAEAQFYPEARSRAIYSESNVLVGYTLFGRDVMSGKWKVFRLMIDAAHQRKGYGEAAMKQIIAEIAKEPDGEEILICYHDPNEDARRLYVRLGFIEQEIDASGRITALLRR